MAWTHFSAFSGMSMLFFTTGFKKRDKKRRSMLVVNIWLNFYERVLSICFSLNLDVHHRQLFYSNMTTSDIYLIIVSLQQCVYFVFRYTQYRKLGKISRSNNLNISYSNYHTFHKMCVYVLLFCLLLSGSTESTRECCHDRMSRLIPTLKNPPQKGSLLLSVTYKDVFVRGLKYGLLRPSVFRLYTFCN